MGKGVRLLFMIERYLLPREILKDEFLTSEMSRGSCGMMPCCRWRDQHAISRDHLCKFSVISNTDNTCLENFSSALEILRMESFSTGSSEVKFFGKRAPFGGSWEPSGWLALGGVSVALFAKREVCSLPRREGGKQGDNLHLNINGI